MHCNTVTFLLGFWENANSCNCTDMRSKLSSIEFVIRDAEERPLIVGDAVYLLATILPSQLTSLRN